MMWLYAVTAHAGPPAGLRGLEDAPVEGLTEGGLCAVVSEVTAAPSAVSEDDLWRHEDVVEALMAEGDVLPVRFGSTLADVEATREVLRDRHEELTEGLQRVHGAVELAVRAVLTVEEPPAPSTASGGRGTEHLRRLAARGAAAQALVDRIHAPLTQRSREGVHRVREGRRPMFTGSYLVDRSETTAFQRAVRELGERLLTPITCTGPWPPYHFVPSGDAG